MERNDGERLHPRQDDLNFLNYSKQYRFIASFLRGKSVLDAACGNGFGSHIFFHEGVAGIVEGIDIDAGAVASALKRYRDDVRINFQVNDVTLMSGIQSESFDVVVSLATIEHVRAYPVFLAQCWRVLKKNGLLIIGTPNVQRKDYDVEKLCFHEKEFSLKELVDAIGFGGFEVTQEWGVNFSARAEEYNRLIATRRKSVVFDWLFKNAYLPFAPYFPLWVRNLLRRNVAGSYSFSEKDVLIDSKDVSSAREFLVFARK